MIWSFSASRAFDRCQRSWFYDTIFGNGVAKDEGRHEIYLLSKLQTISAWRGSIVDKAIETSLVPALRAGRRGREQESRDIQGLWRPLRFRLWKMGAITFLGLVGRMRRVAARKNRCQPGSSDGFAYHPAHF